jgi:hypothetical protein
MLLNPLVFIFLLEYSHSHGTPVHPISSATEQQGFGHS